MNDNFYSNVEVITPEIAREYLKFNKVNRPLNVETVNVYASDMKKGYWRLNGEAICFLKSGALSNGQHRLHAVIKSGCHISFSVARNCDEDSMATYDSGRNRKPADVFCLHGVPNYTNISSIVQRYMMLYYQLNAFSIAGGGIAPIRRDKKVSRKDMLDEYFSTPDLYQQAHSFAASCYRKMRIMTVAEIAGMYVYLIKERKHRAEFVERFFKMLFFHEGTQMSVVERLRDRLLNAKTSKVSISAKYKGALITKAWNAYVLNKDSKILKYNEEAEGKLIFL